MKIIHVVCFGNILCPNLCGACSKDQIETYFLVISAPLSFDLVGINIKLWELKQYVHLSLDTLSIIPFELWVPAHLPLSCKRDWAEALVFRQRKRLLILFLISQTFTLILKCITKFVTIDPKSCNWPKMPWNGVQIVEKAISIAHISHRHS